MKMKTLLYSAFFLTLSALFAAAQQQTAASAAPAKSDAPEAFVFATRQNENLDFVACVPPNRLTVSSAYKIYRNEYITVFAFLAKIADAECKYDFVYSLYMIAPDGSRSDVIKNKRVAGKLAQKNELLFLTDSLYLMFEKSDALGEYKFEIDVKTPDGRAVCEKTHKIILADADFEAEKFETPKDFFAALQKYSEDAAPEKLYSLYKSEHANIVSKRNGVGKTMLVFFREAFRSKPFLLDRLAAEFDTASECERQNGILLFASLGELKKLDGKSLSDSEKSLKNVSFGALAAMNSPYEKPFSAGSFDMLWGEFYAKGNYAPIEKIMSFFAYEKSAQTFLDALKSGTHKQLDKKTTLEAAEFFSATYSVLRNIKTRLAAAYIDFYIIKHPSEFPAGKVKRNFDLCVEYLKFKTESARKAAAGKAAAAKAKAEK